MVARDIYSTLDTRERGVRELIGRWPRGFVIAAIAAPLLLAVAALAANRTVGPTVAMGASRRRLRDHVRGSAVARCSRLRRADEALRLGEQALETVPHAIFVVDSLRPGHPNRYVNPAYAALTGYGVAEAASDGFEPSRSLSTRRKSPHSRASWRRAARAASPCGAATARWLRPSSSCALRHAATAAAIGSGCSKHADADEAVRAIATRCAGRRRAGEPRHGRVLVLAEPRAAVAAQRLRHVARRARTGTAARQADAGRGRDQAQPRAPDPPRQ